MPKKKGNNYPKHCNIHDVANALFCNIQSGWITPEEWKQIVKIVNRRLNENKSCTL